MKTKINLLLCLALVTGLVFTSCEKDEDSKPDEKKLYPIKIIEIEEGYADTTTFEYDENKRLVKEDAGDGCYTTYKYDADGLLIKEEDYEENVLYDYRDFEYNADKQMIKVQWYWHNGVKSSYDTLEYNDQGYLKKESNYSGEELRDYFLYVEYDANENLLKDKYFCGYKSGGINLIDNYDETISQYDDKNNIYKWCDFAQYIFVESGKNNVNQSIVTENYGGLNTTTYTYTYVYNEDKYPIEIICLEDGVEIYKSIIEYKEL